MIDVKCMQSSAYMYKWFTIKIILGDFDPNVINPNDRFEVHAYVASWSTNPMGRGVFIRETWSVREIWDTQIAIDTVYLFNFFITISAYRHL